MKNKDILLALLVAFIWGSYFTISKFTLLSFPPMLAGALRFFLLFLITSPFLLKDKIPLKNIILLGVIYMLNIITLYYAIDISQNLSLVIWITELSAPISLLFGIVVLKEKFNLIDLIGVFLAFIGVLIVIRIKEITQVRIEAVIYALCAALLFASYNLTIKKVSHHNILTLLARMSLFIFPQFLLGSFFQENWFNLEGLDLQSISGLLYKVIICTLLGNYIWFYLLRKYPLSMISPFSLLIPIFGCITSAIFLEEQIEINTLIGGFITLSGLALIVMRKKNENSL